MQYRIWGEMVGGGLHSSLDDPRNTSMFARAGGSTPNCKGSDQSFDLLPIRYHESVPTSPAKLIENRSRCYRQISELNNLKIAGVLTEEEYQMEKHAVMATLKLANIQLALFTN